MQTRGPNSIDRRLAVPMFAVGIVFLVFLAGGLQTVRVAMRGNMSWRPLSELFWWGLLVLYPLFFVELIVHWAAGSRRWKRNVLYLLIPPLRIGSRDHQRGETIWLPGLGWRTADRDLYEQLESALSLPMIFVALLILPILIIQFFWSSFLEQSPTMQFLCDTGESIVWLAFAIELIIMVSVSNNKLVYCLQHWIDLAVVVLPMVAFLRMARLGALLRVQQVGKMARVYRLRGLALRFYRSLLLLNIVERVFFRSPEKRRDRLLRRLAEKQREVAQLRQAIQRLEVLIAERQAAAADVDDSGATAAEASPKRQSSAAENTSGEPEASASMDGVSGESP